MYIKAKRPEDYEEAKRGMETALRIMNSGKCDMLILDEINVALEYGLVTLGSVMEMVKNKPFSMELVLTGRGAHRDLVELADLVTEMQEVKHPFKEGITARKGVEF